MNKGKMLDPKNLFADIGNPGKLTTAQDGEEAAEQAGVAAEIKAMKIKNELDNQEAQIEQATALIVSRTQAIQENHELFDLHTVIFGWFPPDEVKKANALVDARKATALNIDSAASYGVVPDNVVAQFVNSAATRAAGQARLEVARVLDQATGVTRKIAEDESISADEVSKKAQKLLDKWHDAQVLNALFNRLFKQTLNRVTDYQNRLAGVGNDLAKKQVTLETISASLYARQELVKRCLFDTCVSGLALVTILAQQHEVLHDLEVSKNKDRNSPPQVYAQRIQEQEALIEITTKRLVDIKAFAIKLIGLYSVLGNTRFNVAIIKADVVFTRTNLMATLGLQLGLVVDIISTLRISKAAGDIREAEAEAAEKVGVSTQALDEAGNKALTDVQTTIRSLRATVNAAVVGIKNTHANLQRVADMNTQAEKEFAELFATMAV
ncbi:hypothetical protein A3K34_01905 [candidate division WWE3 bacterium RIFOXYC1_FULL_40_10]|uniref:Toxic anion resistance protein n=1 Tax=candidate division WWE3 bacterium RIFOXYA2_FULL_46_9 TaxID=1802636 RepID=A0A1F4W088_UNCKA|nr:MAG: hypothetical protein A3K58_01905 [candidate division WWE3 bacterium RIFOXYB1_FULL_40_22]OGC61617.1 MAG: hypothetical protein A3K37_01905 [candidate division WWE3 bacterium RIFOXYA1_FULL_40_11]OGC62678.1 MAG: hypothetical protein A2264_02310 [candidate division WWE3 bacterium RIFOXYA2_FULL_46_9]OGC64706.1 MAG: hypothetical protein A2326_01540 [candidate division WWE3 bacterium RIFOXYB2_FULL_41_6]OGC66000.1 MAG: hypothetical protein A3K34_01905 [candidate division WWE3 bacterium RIFOXYC1_